MVLSQRERCIQPGLGAIQMWVQGPVSPLSCYVTLDQSLRCSVPQFPHLKNRAQTALTSQGYSHNSKRKSNKVFIY